MSTRKRSGSWHDFDQRTRAEIAAYKQVELEKWSAAMRPKLAAMHQTAQRNFATQAVRSVDGDLIACAALLGLNYTGCARLLKTLGVDKLAATLRRAARAAINDPISHRRLYNRLYKRRQRQRLRKAAEDAAQASEAPEAPEAAPNERIEKKVDAHDTLRVG